MDPIDLTDLLKKFTKGWVAISADYEKVVASGKTLKEVSEKVESLQEKDVVLISAADDYRGYIT
jgi:predicted RNase H-like HicB family nuclease